MVQHRRPHQPQTYGASCTTFTCADLTKPVGAGVTASVADAASAVAVNTAAAPVIMILRMTSSFFGRVARRLRFVSGCRAECPTTHRTTRFVSSKTGFWLRTSTLPRGDERSRDHLYVVVRVVVAKPKCGAADGGTEGSQQIVCPVGDGIALPGVTQLQLDVAGPSHLRDQRGIELVDRGCVQTPEQCRHVRE